MSTSRDMLASVIANILEMAVFRSLLLRALGAASANFIGWLVFELYDRFEDKIVIPLIKMAIRKSLKIYDEQRGEYVYLRFEKALQNDDLDGMKDAIKQMEE